jgi:hypothetical protein
MARLKTDSRQKRLDDGQAYEGFDFKGIHHKPLTAAALKFLQRINSPLYTSNFENYPEVDIVLEYLFATSSTPKELGEAANKWDELQFEFANNYTVKDLSDPLIAESIVRDIGNQNAATIEVRTDGEKKSIAIVPTG